MTHRTLIILLCAVILLATLVLGCDDWDIDRSGFEATATASVQTEMTLWATPPVEVAEREVK